MLLTQYITQICLFLFAAICLFGGSLQMYLGQPDTSPRLDNIHRFLAGVYLTCGIISGWAAVTIEQQNTLVYLIALGGFLGATGRLISMQKVGLPTPKPLWMAYLLSEIIIPIIMVITQMMTNEQLQG